MTYQAQSASRVSLRLTPFHADERDTALQCDTPGCRQPAIQWADYEMLIGLPGRLTRSPSMTRICCAKCGERLAGEAARAERRLQEGQA